MQKIEQSLQQQKRRTRKLSAMQTLSQARRILDAVCTYDICTISQTTKYTPNIAKFVSLHPGIRLKRTFVCIEGCAPGGTGESTCIVVCMSVKRGGIVGAQFASCAISLPCLQLMLL